MGYAIPINTALETAKGIIDGTIVAKTDETTAFLGITGGTLDEDTASAYNAPAGIYVSSVAPVPLHSVQVCRQDALLPDSMVKMFPQWKTFRN